MAKKFELVPKKGRHSDNPVYMNAAKIEYTIVKTESGMWKIVMYKGGYTPKHLRGMFTQRTLAEKALVAWIKRRDKFREAIYPGCPEVKPQNSTGRS
jgi:hypothetical protein